MRWKYYLKYFYFIGSNWNYRLALFTLRQEIIGEKKYAINSMVIERLNNISVVGENITHASIYQGANYFLLEKAFDYLKSINANGHFVDFGCGKGRVLIVAAHYGFTKLTGIDFAAALCESAKKNIQSGQSRFPLAQFGIICDDAANYKVQDDDIVFFFFNPFDESVMLQVAKNILKSLKEKPRTIFIVYLNPVHKEIFLSAGFTEDFHLQKLEYLELSILSNPRYEDEF
ncbi:MAG: class I SAM-dependent methyltransferase [Ginsengibacter sp.]